ncbi:sialic acid-binding Ig-like lectin 14 isoform X1 [Xenopus laevis]|uniref:Sialic acid-binding Ig-like lectin 14 isoform X1 n=1 Tax=Xenopus laevis TaxID=8355 RepID=A0A8J0U3C2_XENLA|nr:sialic acid-binding Ig-like lectin 14 isoform X1 [Xenopus laevis]OCT59481.1 hypothetical protein XELAEV_18000903mg [Xenopus laevis]
MNLLLTLFLLWTYHGGIHSKNPYCTIQTGSVRVSEGDNVIIPCRFSYPGYRRDRSISLRVYWRAGTSQTCGQNTFIYNHTENDVHGNYTGRISLEGNPKEQNVVSLRIQRIRRTDGPMFCCRLEPEDKGLKPWQNIQGTFIQLSGEFSVQQVDTIPAIEGETTVIPCIVHSATEEIREVKWRWGDRLTCNNNPNIVRWTEVNGSQKQSDFSLVDFPRDVSLRIEGVAPSHRKHYCCEVKVGNKTALSDHGTELAVAASEPSVGFSVTQSPELTVQSGGSASISCSFSPNRDPLWVGVYWRVGNLTGPFAYHPSQEMVHPMYKGRTELRRETDLYIRNVQEADNNTSYYCFVILRFCEDFNNFSTETIYGTGTRQHVTAVPLSPRWKLYIILSVRCVLLCIIITAGILGHRKVKGLWFPAQDKVIE